MSESPDGGIKQLNSCFVSALTCLLPTAATFIHQPAGFSSSSLGSLYRCLLVHSAVTPRAVGSGLISDSDTGAVRVSKRALVDFLFFFSFPAPESSFEIRTLKSTRGCVLFSVIGFRAAAAGQLWN